MENEQATATLGDEYLKAAKREYMSVRASSFVAAQELRSRCSLPPSIVKMLKDSPQNN